MCLALSSGGPVPDIIYEYNRHLILDPMVCTYLPYIVIWSIVTLSIERFYMLGCCTHKMI